MLLRTLTPCRALAPRVLAPCAVAMQRFASSLTGSDADLALLRRWQERLSLAQPRDASTSHLSEEVAQLLHTVIRLRNASPESAIPESLCSAFMQHYRRQPEPARWQLLQRLALEFGAPSGDVSAAARRYEQATVDGREPAVVHAAAGALAAAARPLHSHLLAPISSQPSGIPFIVGMRADALAALRAHPGGNAALRALSESLRHALTHWFGPGLLRVERLTWEHTPAAFLERVKEVESVHRFASWGELKDRMGPRRRVFAFTHPTLPGEPLVVCHTALMDHIPASMPAIFNQPQAHQKPEDPTTAVFYSISNSQPGLARVDLGNFLIKQVAKKLVKEFDSIKTVVTLSPVPGFAAWLRRRLLAEVDGPDATVEGAERATRLLDQLEAHAWLYNPELEAELRPRLMALCAEYLLTVRRRGLAFDPVAAFHLRNGAQLWRLNWRADISEAGLSRSHGIMVNYLYDFDCLEERNRQYVVAGTIAAHSQVTQLLADDTSDQRLATAG